MSSEPTLNHSDQEALSAYLDGMLTEEEKAVLEARLQQEPDLRDELNTLRQTVRLVQELPTLKAPRNFTLTEDMLEQSNEEELSLIRRMRSIPRNVIQMPTLSLVSAAASVALVMLGFILIYGYEQDTEPQFTVVSGTVGLTSNSAPDDVIENRTQDNSAVAMAPTATVIVTESEDDEQVGAIANAMGGDSDTTADDGAVSEESFAQESNLVEAEASPVDPPASAAERQQPDPYPSMTASPAAEAYLDAADQDDVSEGMEEAQLFALVTAEAVTPIIQGTPEPPSQTFMGFATDTPAEDPALTGEVVDGLEMDESEIANEQQGSAPGENGNEGNYNDLVQKFEELDQTDLTPIGIILIVAGILLAVVTFLMKRLRNAKD